MKTMLVTGWATMIGIMAAGSLAAQCTDVTTVPSGPITSGTACYSNTGALAAGGVQISGTASVSFIAGQSIRLSNGFRATAGTASSPSGWASLAEVYGLVNTMTAGRISSLLYLADHGASAWVGGFAPGSAQTVENSQCKIFGTGASATGAGTQLAVPVPVEFKGGFAGTKTNYLQARDNIGQSSWWQAMGTWTVSSTTQYTLSSIVAPVGAPVEGSVGLNPSGGVYASGTANPGQVTMGGKDQPWRFSHLGCACAHYSNTRFPLALRVVMQHEGETVHHAAEIRFEDAGRQRGHWRQVSEVAERIGQAIQRHAGPAGRFRLFSLPHGKRLRALPIPCDQCHPGEGYAAAGPG